MRKERDVAALLINMLRTHQEDSHKTTEEVNGRIACCIEVLLWVMEIETGFQETGDIAVGIMSNLTDAQINEMISAMRKAGTTANKETIKPYGRN